MSMRAGVKSRKKPDFDVVVYGASGYTGRLVAEHMQQVASDFVTQCQCCLVVLSCHLL
jgi:hypothetical protein